MVDACTHKRCVFSVDRPPRVQVNAFCNTDDITWGTKNLDTKKDATEAKTLMKSGLAYSANQVGVGWDRPRLGASPAPPASCNVCPPAPTRAQTKESKSFWKAMMKVHEKLTDINQIKMHNQIKETKLKVGGMHATAPAALPACVVTSAVPPSPPCTTLCRAPRPCCRLSPHTC